MTTIYTYSVVATASLAPTDEAVFFRPGASLPEIENFKDKNMSLAGELFNFIRSEDRKSDTAEWAIKRAPSEVGYGERSRAHAHFLLEYARESGRMMEERARDLGAPDNHAGDPVIQLLLDAIVARFLELDADVMHVTALLLEERARAAHGMAHLREQHGGTAWAESTLGTADSLTMSAQNREEEAIRAAKTGKGAVEVFRDSGHGKKDPQSTAVQDLIERMSKAGVSDQGNN